MAFYERFETDDIMAEIIIPDIMQAPKGVGRSNANDVLYRYRNGEMVGLTVTHFSKR